MVNELKCLVTGCGRCGTVYMARFLTSIGLPCGHESVFDYRGIDYALVKLQGAIPFSTSYCSKVRFKDGIHHPEPKWINEEEIVAESSYMAAPFLNHDCLKNTKFIHLVRHPVKVINSFCNYLVYFQNRHPALWEPTKKYETFIFSHLPELYCDMSQYERGALFYIQWNQMIENNLKGVNYLLHRAEDKNDEIFDYLNLPRKDFFFDDREINAFRKPSASFSLDQLPKGRILDSLIEIGMRYGYKMDSKYLLI
jgi:hypothetical protein